MRNFIFSKRYWELSLNKHVFLKPIHHLRPLNKCDLSWHINNLQMMWCRTMQMILVDYALYCKHDIIKNSAQMFLWRFTLILYKICYQGLCSNAYLKIDVYIVDKWAIYFFMNDIKCLYIELHRYSWCITWLSLYNRVYWPSSISRLWYLNSP